MLGPGERMNEKSKDVEIEVRAKTSRVTWVGYFALGLSILAALGIYGMVAATGFAVDLFVWGESLPEGVASNVWFAAWCLLLFCVFGGITADIVAGTQGRGNQIAGLVGGSLVLSPLVVTLAYVGLSLL